MSVDPVASMGCWPLEIELGGQEYEIPALPASGWWAVLAEADLTLIVEMISGDASDLDDALLSGELTSEDMIQALTEALEEAAGRSLHVAMVLVHLAIREWPAINGQMARNGFRWDVMPLGAALDAIHSIIWEGLDEKGRKEFERILIPTKPGRVDREKALSEFEAMAGPRPTSGVRVRSIDAQSADTPPRTPTQPRPRRPRARSASPS